MVKKGDYKISDFYQGGYSSLNPDYGSVFTGYRANAGSFGLSTDPRTANILQETSEKLKTGIKHIEISAVNPGIFESIPQQHLKEVKRKAKLAGVEISVHAPIVEASGISQNGFSESNRESAKRQMQLAVERSYELNPEGNIPVTFHSSAAIPDSIPQKGKDTEEALVINSETGSIAKIPLRERFALTGEVEKTDIIKELNNVNESSWTDNITNLSNYAERGKEAIRDSILLAKTVKEEREKGKDITQAERIAESKFSFGENFLNDSYRRIRELFETANRYGSPEDKKVLGEFVNNVKSKVEQINNSQDIHEKIALKEEVIDEGVKSFEKISPPKIYKPLTEFARENTTETFSEVAWDSYKKFKDKTPIISIENPPAGGAFSTGKELKGIVEATREKFVEKAVRDGMGEKAARDAAERTIGVTWDVGHINMLRKYGYEAKDIIKETEQVAPLVKHVHLSDNFGIEHTELPMGMGNVPVGEMLKKIPEKEIKKIIEAGNWYEHFKTSPVKETFEAFGSPMYPFGPVYWNQNIGLQQGYFSGMEGSWLPQINYQLSGTYFSQLPKELGGQIQGGQGNRMSGKPME